MFVRSRSSSLSLTGCVVLALGACSSSPAPPPPADQDPAGDYQVSSVTLDLEDASRPTVPDPQTGDGWADSRTLPTTVWFPTEGDGPFPVVVFSHGRYSTPEAYTALLASWASSGLVVAAPRFPLTSQGSPDVIADVVNQSADVSFVLDQVLALDAQTGAALEGRLDEERVAVAGHSAGAVTTLGLLTDCCADSRIDAAVVLAGAPAEFILPSNEDVRGVEFLSPGVSTLFVHGAADEPIPITEGEAVYEEVPGARAFVTLTSGTHSAPFDDHDDPAWETVRAVTTDFLLWALQDDEAAPERLRSAVGASGRASLTDDRLPQ